MLSNFFTLVEAAEVLRISPATLYGWVHQRRIPFRKHGGRLVFDRQELEAWSESNKINPLEHGVVIGGRFHGKTPKRRPNAGQSSLKTKQDTTLNRTPERETEYGKSN